LYYYTAQSFWKNADEHSAAAMYELAISLCERARTVDESQQANIVKRLGVLHDDLGLALAHLERFYEAIGQHELSFEVDPDPLHRLITRNNLAVVYADMGEYALAARESEKVWDEMSSGEEGDLPLWATALETWAAALIHRGRVETALGLLEIAAAGLQLPSATIDARLRNAGYRLQGCKLAADYPKAAAVFREMWGLAVERVGQPNIDHFFYGHNHSVDHILPASSDFWECYSVASAALGTHDWERAIAFYDMAAAIAHEAKDQLSLMRCAVDVAAAKGRAGAIDNALHECEVVRRAAMHAGFALPVALSAATMASLMQRGSDQGARAGALATTAEALAYARLHHLLVDETNPSPDDDNKRLGRVDVGVLEMQVAEAANDARAYDLAEEFFRRAISSSLCFADRFGERIRSIDLICNCKVGLLRVLDAIPERSADAAMLARELRAELARADTEQNVRLVILNYLGTRGTNTTQSLADLRAATELLETLRANRPRGVARSDLDRDYPVYPVLLRRLQESDASVAEEFSVLQAMRARRLMETLTAASGDPRPFQGIEFGEVQQLLARMPRLTTFVDVTTTDGGLRAYLVDQAGLRSVDISGDVTPLRSVQWGDVRERAAEVVALVAHSPILIDLASAITAELEKNSTVLIAVDDDLANLPLHAISIGDTPWCDVVSIGRIPAAGILRFTSSSRAWSGHSVVAGNSNDDLSGAQKECEAVAGLLGVDLLVRGDCTFDRVGDALTAAPGTRLDVVHLAVHGRADARRGGRSSLLFAGEHPTWVPFADLAALHWNANLIVFSGCSTAVGGPRHGAGLYGIAQAAAEAGATTVIASLWPVNDTTADIFMEVFYTELSRRRSSGLIDLRELMDHARTTLRQTALLDLNAVRRDGRELIIADPESDSPPVEDAVQAAMMHWAPFVLIGEPTLVA
jgi:CHAT domain-containing protein/tetratricopeptide (TPR) repeat protein